MSTTAPKRPARPLLLLALLAALGLAAVSFLGTQALFRRSLAVPAAAGATAADPSPAPSGTARPGTSAAPGSGVVTGRLVDAVTGLPVPDAGASLMGSGRRGLSGPDGRFRFDGVPPGPVTIAFGPVDGYVPRTLEARQAADGLDLGITPLLPVSAPTYLVPEFGGVVPGCQDTRLLFASTALAVPASVSLTCIEQAAEFPAAPPAGRLPLAVVDAAPGTLAPASPAQLTVQLPPQPRYGAGVALDALRLDLDRLRWQPAGQLLVDPGGRTASGPVSRLGTYLVVAPPFGQFPATAGEGPVVHQFAVSDRPDGGPVDVFGPDTPVVFASFDYARMENTPILVRTVDGQGGLAHESRRPYTGEGHDNVPMVAPDNRRWPIGEYLTTVFVGEPPVAAGGGIPWRVAAQPTPRPLPPTLPPAAPILAAGPAPAAAWPALPGGACSPGGWWARLVQPGDTLSGLAARTGASVAGLMAANCLKGPELYVGQVLYLPRPPLSAKPLVPLPPAKPPVYPTWVAPSGPGPGIIPTMPPVYPTPWPGQPGLPGFPEATPWKQAPPPGGWTPAPAPAQPTLAPRARSLPPQQPPAPAPTREPPPPAPPPAGPPTPVAKWTPDRGPEPTLAPRPTPAP